MHPCLRDAARSAEKIAIPRQALPPEGWGRRSHDAGLDNVSNAVLQSDDNVVCAVNLQTTAAGVEFDGQSPV